jgi:hypothetical protein
MKDLTTFQKLKDAQQKEERAQLPWNFPLEIAASPSWIDGNGYKYLELDRIVHHETYNAVLIMH